MYSKELYTKVKDDLAALRLKHARELDDRRGFAFKKNPRLLQIENILKEKYRTLGLKVLEEPENPLNFLKEAEKITKVLKQERDQILMELNLPENYLSMEYECSLCRDQGVIKNHFCTCFHKRLMKYAQEDSNLSPILDKQNFEYFDFSYYSASVDKEKGFSPRKNIKNVFEICIRFVKNFDTSDENLFLFGPTGLGKTFLSSCIAKDLLDKGKSVFYQSAPKIFKIMEDYKFGRGNTENLASLIDKIYSCDLLIIDDLGTEMSTSFSSSALFDIINSRIFSKKKTIINTNIDNNELVAIYSDRVVSRLIGHYTQLEFFGNDIRLITKSAVSKL